MDKKVWCSLVVLLIALAGCGKGSSNGNFKNDKFEYVDCQEGNRDESDCLPSDGCEWLNGDGPCVNI